MSSQTLPSAYECELETLLRERDKQITHLKAEVASLRTQLNPQSSPDPEAATLPAPLAALVLPYIHAARTTAAHHPTSSTVTAAVTQRAKALQEENDELYNIFRLGETGKLKEQVHGLKRVVGRLEQALQDSHQVITSLSNELDKSYDTFMSSARQNAQLRAPSPYQSRNSYSDAGNSPSSSSRQPPTGPRAYKKQRVSDSQSDQSGPRQPPSGPSGRHRPSSSSRQYSGRDREQNRRYSNASSHYNKPEMDVEDERSSPVSDRRERDRERESRPERGRKDKYRERDRDSRPSRRNGPSNGSIRGQGTGGKRNGGSSETSTLAERMGL